MLKSCSYCNRIHDSKYICDQKRKAINDRQRRFKDNREIDKFRNSKEWKLKREEIKQRDNYLCQICIRELYNTLRKYTYDELSVHHALSLATNFDKRLDDDILITTCNYHHKKMERGEIPVDEVLEIIKEQERKRV